MTRYLYAQFPFLLLCQGKLEIFFLTTVHILIHVILTTPLVIYLSKSLERCGGEEKCFSWQQKIVSPQLFSRGPLKVIESLTLHTEVVWTVELPWLGSRFMS